MHQGCVFLMSMLGRVLSRKGKLFSWNGREKEKA
jgi:hypothetical protein